MVPEPPACPTTEQLRLLLAEELSAADQEALERHVEGCPHCQGLLEQLTMPGSDAPIPGLRHGTGHRYRAHAIREPHLHFLRALGDGPPPSLEGTDQKTLTTLPSSFRTPGAFPGYELLDVLGHGGMSVVFRARQPALNRLVALKVLSNLQANARDLARFQAEAEAIASLHHPNIVQVYDVGTHDGRPYFTLELVDGGSLARLLDGRPQDPVAAAAFLETVARAVQTAHEHGIIHRDLKPANILLQRISTDFTDYTDKNERKSAKSVDDFIPKIADFGLAKHLQTKEEMTQSGTVLGTPSYMAPEQAQGRSANLGPAADIYALGAVLYELLTGRPPFNGATPLEILHRVVHDEPAAVSLLVPGVPRDLQTICLTCLQKEPGRRYASALALAEDLHRFLHQQPIAARPPSMLDRCSKFARRNKGLVGGIVGIMAALVVGTAVAIVFALAEMQARYQADANATRADANAAVADQRARQALHESYRAQLTAAVLALEAHDLAEVSQLLDATPTELRGWEWKVLHTRLVDELPSASRIDGQFPTIPTLLPGGRRLVTQDGVGGPFTLRDADSGEMVRQLPPGRFLGIAPLSAGTLLLIATPDGRLEVMDEAGKTRQTGVRAGADPGPAALSPDGATLALATTTAAGAARVEFRDMTTGNTLQATPCSGKLTLLNWSPDGTLLAGVGEDNAVALWDANSGAVTGVCRGHRRPVRGVMFRSKGGFLLSWAEDGTVRQWRLPHGEPITTMHGHSRPVQAAGYSPDGRWIASGSEDHTLRFWRVANGEPVAVLPIHADSIYALAFDAEATTLMTASLNGTLRRWPLLMLSDPRVLRGHTSFVYPVAYSPNGRWIATGGWDNVVRLWDAAGGEQIRVLRGPSSFVACLAISPDSTRLAARSMDGRLRIWDTSSGELLHELDDGGLEDFRPPGSALYRDACFLPQSVAFTPDCALVACGYNNRIRFWDLATGREQAALTLPVQGSIRKVVFSPDGRRIAIAAAAPALCLVDFPSGQIQHVLTGHTGLVYAVAFSPDGSRLVSAGDDQIVRLWDTETGTLQRELRGHTDQIFAAAFHHDGHRLATGGRDRDIRIWDPATGDEMARLKGHTDYVFSLAFSPDGQALVSGSGDTTVRVWDTVPLRQRRAARD